MAPARCARTPSPTRLATAAEKRSRWGWGGDAGPAKGKQIVFIAGDHEYRGEETLPALARIMARHYGCTCTFLVTTDPKDGTIQPGSSNISGLEALKTADLMVVFLRFHHFPDDQMKCIDDYLK